MRCIGCGFMNKAGLKNCRNCGFPLKKPNMNIKTMDYSDLNLMMHVSKDQGDFKEITRIQAEWNRRNKK